MQNDNMLLDFIFAFSGFTMLALVVLNALIYGMSEGKNEPFLKQMVACLVSMTVFVASCIVKMFKWILSS